MWQLSLGVDEKYSHTFMHKIHAHISKVFHMFFKHKFRMKFARCNCFTETGMIADVHRLLRALVAFISTCLGVCEAEAGRTAKDVVECARKVKHLDG